MKKDNVKTKLLLVCGVVTFMLLFHACSPYPPQEDYISDYDIVYTNYNDAKNFSSYTTYALPEKIPYITNSDDEEYLDDDNLDMANYIRTQLHSQMTARGYTEVDASTDTPDLLLNIGVLNTKVVTGYPGCWWYDNPYYWDWYPGWGWGYGWGWDYYPCWGSYYSYDTGSLVLDLVDVNASEAENCDQSDSSCQLDVAWNSIVNGLLNDTSANLESRINKAIKQAFEQSPYLKK